MTHLRQAMLEELQRRNYAKTTVYYYLKAVERFAKYFHTSAGPTQSEPLADVSGVPAARAEARAADGEAPRLGAPVLLREDAEAPVPAGRHPVSESPTPAPGDPHARRKSPDLIDGAKNLTDRTMLMVLYSTGMRNAELRHLQVRDIDSRRMLIHIQHGKGGRDRYVPAQRHDCWRRSACTTAGCGRRRGCFPARSRTGGPTSRSPPKVVWDACRDAATRAQLEKRVSPHLLRHSYASHLVEAGADLRTVQLLLGHVKLEHTVIYLHLSQRHLQAVANPLDAMPVSGADTVRRTRRLHKR